MITKTTYPNGSIRTEYNNYVTQPCDCVGSCNCLSLRYPKYQNKPYSLANQQPTVCVEHPLTQCDCLSYINNVYHSHVANNTTQSYDKHPHIVDSTFYNTPVTSNQSLQSQTPYQQSHHLNHSTNTYNILPQPKVKEADIYNPYTLNPFAINSYLQTGYPANLYQVPKTKDWALVQGDGIKFEEYETGLKLHNNGMKSLTIAGISGSGIIAQNTGTNQEAKYILGINTNEFAANNNLVQEVTFNGKSYTPVNGKIFINSGASGAPINRLNSLDNTISIIPTSVGEYNIQTAKVTVKGVETKTTSVDRKLVEFIDGVNTSPKLTNNNQVSIDVIDIVKTVNNQLPDGAGNINISVASQTIFYQFRKTLSLSDIAAFQGSGVDIVSMTINQGNKPTQLSNSDGMTIYVNDNYLGLDKYTRAGNIVTLNNGTVINPNDSLSVVIIKSV